MRTAYLACPYTGMEDQAIEQCSAVIDYCIGSPEYEDVVIICPILMLHETAKRYQMPTSWESFAIVTGKQ